MKDLPNNSSNFWQKYCHQYTDGKDAAVKNHNMFQPKTSNNSHSIH